MAVENLPSYRSHVNPTPSRLEETGEEMTRCGGAETAASRRVDEDTKTGSQNFKRSPPLRDFFKAA